MRASLLLWRKDVVKDGGSRELGRLDVGRIHLGHVGRRGDWIVVVVGVPAVAWWEVLRGDDLALSTGGLCRGRRGVGRETIVGADECGS